MNKKVLVFPCGSEIGLEIYRALRFSKDFELFGGSSVNDHGMFVYENYIDEIPFVDSKDFLDHINKVIIEKKIDFIIPAHDSVVVGLARVRDKLKANLVTSPIKTCEIARSKKKTYEHFIGIINTPKIYSIDSITSFPVFLKPDVGQGSKGILIAKDAAEVLAAQDKDPSLLILEFLPGEEYTVDCFTDKDGQLLFSQARQRSRVTNGISVNSKVVHDPEFQHIAQEINKKLEFRGVWFFQVKRDTHGELSLMEVAPRIAGTMALCRMQGANLALLSLYDAMDQEVSIVVNDFDIEIDRALSAKYKHNIKFETVYVDLDDTIILNNTTNYLLMGLLYKFIGQGKRLILITKHLKEVETTLASHRISPAIFDEIVSLSKVDNKSHHISGSAIFIDDSFSERKEVSNILKIPVFDVSEAVELL